MKSISTLVIIGLLFFACKLCSFTGNTNRPIPQPSPTPRPLLYAADLIKPKLGSFTLVKKRTRDDVVKMVSSEPTARNIVGRSNDSGIGAYNSEKGEPVLLWVFSFPSPDVAASMFNEFENDIRGSYRWRNVKSTTLEHGKRLEGIDSKSRAVVIWTNGYWLFWVWSSEPELTNSFVSSVGY